MIGIIEEKPNICAQNEDVSISEFIKEFKIPQKEIAGRIGMNYTTFRKKLNVEGYYFTEVEEKEVRAAVVEYVNDLQKKVEKFLPPIA